jgi:hypothetical protein
MDHANIQERIPEPSQRQYTDTPPTDELSEGLDRERHQRTDAAHQIKSGNGAFVARELISTDGPALAKIEGGRITTFRVKPTIDRGLIREIEKIKLSIPERMAKNEAAKKRADDFFNNRKFMDAENAGATQRSGERELERLRAALPDRLEKFPARWNAEIAKLKSFKNELSGIIDEIDAELKDAEKTGKDFMADHTPKAETKK